MPSQGSNNKKASCGPNLEKIHKNMNKLLEGPGVMCLFIPFKFCQLFTLQDDARYTARLEQGRKEYDKAYARNLHEMEHGMSNSLLKCSIFRMVMLRGPPFRITQLLDDSLLGFRLSAF